MRLRSLLKSCMQKSIITLLFCLLVYAYLNHDYTLLDKKQHLGSQWSDGRLQVGSTVFIKISKANTSSNSLQVFPSSATIQDKNTVIPADIDDVFITVKTTGKFHHDRLDVILKTWFNLAPKSTYFFTDIDDTFYKKQTNNHLINTKCGTSHNRQELSCKMGVEYAWFMKSTKKWWCHFDDDNYVNVNGLLSLLQKYNWQESVYLGKLSVNKAIFSTFNSKPIKFWFATGGAGLCVSKTLAIKISPWCKGKQFVKTSTELRLPDDCTLGFIITNRVGVNLTQCSLFHSHLEWLQAIKQDTFSSQVTFSFQTNPKDFNVISVKHPVFNATVDPTRMLALHCILYPKTAFCRKKRVHEYRH